MKSGIYKIRFKCDCFYIGSAVNLTKRKLNHLSDLKQGKHCNAIMQNHFNKYGKYIFEIIEHVPPEDLVKREQYFIDTLKPTINIVPIAGNTLGYKHTPKTKEKMAVIARKRALDNAWLAKVSKGWFIKGSKLSPEKREVLRIRMINDNPFKGRKHSEETRKKMSVRAKARDKSVYNLEGFALGRKHNCIKVVLENNGKKTVYNSISDLEKSLGMNGANGSLRRKLSVEGNHYLKKYDARISYG